MKIRYVLSAVASAALIAGSPAYATWPDDDDGGSGRGDPIDISVEYDNDIDTSIRTDVSFEKDLHIIGGALVLGLIGVDSSAVAVNDPKQILDDLDLRDATDNSTGPIDVRGSGNIGVNVASGALNQQLNSAALAISDTSGLETGMNYGGWAEASTTSLQHINDLDYNPGSCFLFFCDPESETTNRVGTVDVGGSGNIGVNVAAGAFNQQSNLMTLASASDSSLAEANAGLVQYATNTDVNGLGDSNRVAGVTIAGASGNVGVNVAAGVGNQQLNSLTIATSSSSGGGGI